MVVISTVPAFVEDKLAVTARLLVPPKFTSVSVNGMVSGTLAEVFVALTGKLMIGGISLYKTVNWNEFVDVLPLVSVRTTVIIALPLTLVTAEG